MSRSKSHRHVRTIMAAMDRVFASPDRDDIAPGVASSIITYGNCAEEFECFIRPKREQWTAEGLRAVVLA